MWAVPWPQLILLAGIALVVLAIVVGPDPLAAQGSRAARGSAREQGRREAAVADDASPAAARRPRAMPDEG